MAISGALHFFTEDYYATTYSLQQLRALVIERSPKSADARPASSEPAVKSQTKEAFSRLPWMSKLDCIRILMDEDRKEGKWTGPFRFLDLARELRDMIYTELLSIPIASGGIMEKTGCDPAILRTSKQMEGEGREILYGDNPREITIRCSDSRMAYVGSGRVICNDVGENYARFDRATHAYVASMLWDVDKQIGKFKKVLVHLILENDKERQGSQSYSWGPRGLDEEACMAASHHLYHVISNLASSTVLKTVEIRVDSANFDPVDWTSTSSQDIWLQRTLWPLTLLGQSPSIKLTGAPSDVEQCIKANFVATKVLPSKVLYDRLNRIIGHCRQLRMRMRLFEHGGVLGHKGLVQCEAILKEAYRLRHGELQFVNEDFVEDLMQSISSMEAQLKSPEIVELNRKWTEWMSTRHTRGRNSAASRARMRC